MNRRGQFPSLNQLEDWMEASGDPLAAAQRGYQWVSAARAAEPPGSRRRKDWTALALALLAFQDGWHLARRSL